LCSEGGNSIEHNKNTKDMRNTTTYLSKLKSVGVTRVNSKRNLLLSFKSLLDFQLYLEICIKDEVFIVSTNVGMQVFYSSELDYSVLIKEQLFLRIKDNEHMSCVFRNNTDSIAVFNSFSEVMEVFSKYPQVFLAFSKKFFIY